MLRAASKVFAQVRASKRARIRVHYHTSPLAYALWWFGILFLHIVNIAYYAGVALLYRKIERTFLFFQIAVYSIGISNSEYPAISSIHAAIAALHGACVISMVGASMHAKTLIYYPDLKPVYRYCARHPFIGGAIARVLPSRFLTSSSPHRSEINSVGSTSSASLSRRLSDSIGRGGSSIFSRDGILGVDSVYFDHVLLVRELIETTLQTYQLLRMTQLLPRLWLIRLYLALLVANCWAVPFLHRLYRDRETTRRMLCLLCDAILDMVSSIGVTLILFSIYAPQYDDPNGYGFAHSRWSDDAWLANMIHEFKMMMVASWSDMVSRLVFALGLLQCVDSIKEMLTPVAPTKRSNAPRVAEAPPVVSIGNTSTRDGIGQSTRWASLVPLFAIETTSTTQRTAPSAPPASRIVKQHSTVTYCEKKKPRNVRKLAQQIVPILVHIVGPLLFVLWGCAILIIHLKSEANHSSGECDLRLKPWFSQKAGCSLVQFNCHDMRSTGRDDVMIQAFETFDPQRAARLVFRHCTELVITPAILAYTHLSGIKIYNSTVVSWGDDAALTQSCHDELRSLFMVRTNFPNGELPPGLLSHDFPRFLTSFISSVTNIRSLPDNLAAKWPRRMNLAFEFSRLTSIPDVLIEMKPDMISVAGCDIAEVKPEIFEIPTLGALLLGLTRVQELPRTVLNPGGNLRVLLLQSTNITTFWPWMEGFITRTMMLPSELFNAYDTPYCRELQEIAKGAGGRFSFSPSTELARVMDVSTPTKLAFAQDAVDCTPGFPTNFPLSVEDALHGLR